MTKKFTMNKGLKEPKFRNRDKKSISQKVVAHEEETAKVIRGKVQPNSGRINGRGWKGDAISERYLADSKLTQAKQITFSWKWIEKLHYDAVGLDKVPLFHFKFDNMTTGIPKDWVCIPVNEFERLIDGYTEEE